MKERKTMETPTPEIDGISVVSVVSLDKTSDFRDLEESGIHFQYVTKDLITQVGHDSFPNPVHEVFGSAEHTNDDSKEQQD